MTQSTENRLGLPLHAIAHGRAGDKGNRSNISVIAYRPEAWPALLEQVTEARVLETFRPLGVNASLAIDRHGKALSYRLLGAITVEVTLAMVLDGSPYFASADWRR